MAQKGGTMKKIILTIILIALVGVVFVLAGGGKILKSAGKKLEGVGKQAETIKQNVEECSHRRSRLRPGDEPTIAKDLPRGTEQMEPGATREVIESTPSSSVLGK